MSDPFIGWHTIYGADGEHETPYMTRVWIGRLRLHIFHRGDADPDPHDHPWDFWTLPLTSYVEEVAVRCLEELAAYDPFQPRRYDVRLSRYVVKAMRLHHRPAEHTHRVLGPLSGYLMDGTFYPKNRLPHRKIMPGDGIEACTGRGRIITLVWLGRSRRSWGFLKGRDGRWCWTPWREYVFGGGKHAPCEPSDGGAA